MKTTLKILLLAGLVAAGIWLYLVLTRPKTLAGPVSPVNPVIGGDDLALILALQATQMSTGSAPISTAPAAPAAVSYSQLPGTLPFILS